MDEYDVDINGITHTLQLSDADAKAYGKAAKKVTRTKAATAPANKQAPAPDTK
ncbi:hypothetical protein [Rathayibacter sp. AY2B5]|uniref:hypothetical protein n=1 Tax=Rathayibacter sp. AY2B5 TaxID=2080570 RepID=UPI0015E42F47|nr:hypothetical protein [Rathayibacter sp. AY2B5]